MRSTIGGATLEQAGKTIRILGAVYDLLNGLDAMPTDLSGEVADLARHTKQVTDKIHALVLSSDGDVAMCASDRATATVHLSDGHLFTTYAATNSADVLEGKQQSLTQPWLPSPLKADVFSEQDAPLHEFDEIAGLAAGVEMYVKGFFEALAEFEAENLTAPQRDSIRLVPLE